MSPESDFQEFDVNDLWGQVYQVSWKFYSQPTLHDGALDPSEKVSRIVDLLKPFEYISMLFMCDLFQLLHKYWWQILYLSR